MNKYLFFAFVFCIVNSNGFAQNKDERAYKERAAEVQQEIWAILKGLS